MTGCIREHLKKQHKDIYQTTVDLKKLKHSGESVPLSQDTVTGNTPFSMAKFLELLQRWIVADDQVSLFIFRI